jgi:preprotein translocase subunit SecF
MFIIRFKNLFVGLTLALVAISIGLVVAYGLHFGIDFTGGSIVEVEYPAGRGEISHIKDRLAEHDFGQILLQETGTDGVVIRTKALSNEERNLLLSSLSDSGKLEIIEKRFDSVGPVVGNELRQKALLGIAVAILLIVLYITFAFRKVSAPVSSWKYGLIAILTLVHDVIVPTGFYVLYTHFVGGDIDILFVTALLAIVGFSIHDTIVVFDRVRENLREAPGKQEFSTTVGQSLSQTFARSINTSLTVVMVLTVLFLVGPEATRHFSIVMLVGIIAGTYSSVFFASPILVLVEKWQKNR